MCDASLLPEVMKLVHSIAELRIENAHLKNTISQLGDRIGTLEEDLQQRMSNAVQAQRAEMNRLRSLDSANERQLTPADRSGLPNATNNSAR